MKIEEYRRMFELEDSHWWYRGLRRIFLTLLDQRYKGERLTSGRDHKRILDAGCGTGAMLKCLRRYGSPIGVDISSEALKFCGLRKEAEVVGASIQRLPFKGETFDIVTSFDVLYHKDVHDDINALREFHRILKRDGRLALNVPAYDFLYSEHDEAIHTRHRYTRGELERKVRECGFVVEKASYWNTFLFPVAATVRLTKRLIGLVGGRREARSELKPLSFWANASLASILSLEALLLKRVNFPFGLSVLLLARKGD